MHRSLCPCSFLAVLAALVATSPGCSAPPERTYPTGTFVAALDSSVRAYIATPRPRSSALLEVLVVHYEGWTPDRAPEKHGDWTSVIDPDEASYGNGLAVPSRDAYVSVCDLDPAIPWAQSLEQLGARYGGRYRRCSRYVVLTIPAGSPIAVAGLDSRLALDLDAPAPDGRRLLHVRVLDAPGSDGLVRLDPRRPFCALRIHPAFGHEHTGFTELWVRPLPETPSGS